MLLSDCGFRNSIPLVRSMRRPNFRLFITKSEESFRKPLLAGCLEVAYCRCRTFLANVQIQLTGIETTEA